jgi:SagB-type dehydrogenase family enzyme
MQSTTNGREFLGADLWQAWDTLETDQKKRLPAPPVQKPYSSDARLIDLVEPAKFTVGRMSVLEAIRQRKSRRQFTGESLTLEELSFLLWATQGVRQVTPDGVTTKRTVPSAGSRHPFETYVMVNRVDGLTLGLYRYLALEHKLCLVYADETLGDKIPRACSAFAKESAAVFVWTAIPYRTAWRYSVLSWKFIAQDSGHLCENLYLACEAIGAGTCAVGAYNQQAMDELLGVDGQDEFTVYSAPVGKISADA